MQVNNNLVRQQIGMKQIAEKEDLLAVFDIGNTNIKGALFKGARIVRRWSDPSLACQKAAFVQRLFASKLGASRKRLQGVCIVSVVPGINKLFAVASRSMLGLKPFFATPRTIGISLGKYNPRKIGTDRLVNATAAHAIYKKGVVVIDAGTALTFDAVDSKGRYLGGAIAPGIGMAGRALNEMTARLPLVKISRPSCAIGTSTRECISSGIFHGWAGIVRNLVREISKEMKTRPLVIATGRDAEMIAKASGVVDEIRKDLVFEGLKIMWDDFRRSSLYPSD